MKRTLRILSLAGLTVWGSLAQSAVTLVGASYSAPASFEVAPGQVVTLFFSGIQPGPGGALRQGRADSQVLPHALAGLALRLKQEGAGLDVPVPLFAVRQENQCGGTQPVAAPCVLTSVRVQIPFELSLVPSAEPSHAPRPSPAYLILEEEGRLSQPFQLSPVTVNAHVVTTCDIEWTTDPAVPCNRPIFHADGSRVTEASPARHGETLVAYAYGLGPVWQEAETGRPSQQGATIPQSGVLRVWATVRNEPLSASASAPRFYDAEASKRPGDALHYAGVAPGFTGLYQMNIQIPDNFSTKLACGADVRANAAVLITTARGSEVVPLCVVHPRTA